MQIKKKKNETGGSILKYKYYIYQLTAIPKATVHSSSSFSNFLCVTIPYDIVATYHPTANWRLIVKHERRFTWILILSSDHCHGYHPGHCWCYTEFCMPGQNRAQVGSALGKALLAQPISQIDMGLILISHFQQHNLSEPFWVRVADQPMFGLNSIYSIWQVCCTVTPATKSEGWIIINDLTGLLPFGTPLFFCGFFVIAGHNGADTYTSEPSQNHIPIKPFDVHIFGNEAEARER